MSAEPFWISPAEAEKSLRIIKDIYRQSYPDAADTRFPEAFWQPVADPLKRFIRGSLPQDILQHFDNRLPKWQQCVL